MTTPDTTPQPRDVTVTVGGAVVDVRITERGVGQPFLVLHGGAGPQSVDDFAGRLATAGHARVLTPTHPGFGGTLRPAGLGDIRSLAALYAQVLDVLDLSGVTVVGNSIGGWVATELALLHTGRVSGFVLVDPAGIEVPGHPIADFFSLTLDEVIALSWHDPSAAVRVDPATLPAAQQAVLAGNRAALLAYGGTAMADPTLVSRLAEVDVPTLVVWGESDRIVDIDYGRAFAAAIPGADFEVLTGAGHVPQLETPDQLVPRVLAFTAQVSDCRSVSR